MPKRKIRSKRKSIRRKSIRRKSIRRKSSRKKSTRRKSMRRYLRGGATGDPGDRLIAQLQALIAAAAASHQHSESSERANKAEKPVRRMIRIAHRLKDMLGKPGLSDTEKETIKDAKNRIIGCLIRWNEYVENGMEEPDDDPSPGAVAAIEAVPGAAAFLFGRAAAAARHAQALDAAEDAGKARAAAQLAAGRRVTIPKIHFPDALQPDEPFKRFTPARLPPLPV